MSADPQNSDTPEPSIVQDLVIECLDRLEAQGLKAIDDVCREHPEHAGAIRRKLAKLQEVGLLDDAAAAPAAQGEVRIPEKLGEFRLLAKLGGGGMGVVYLAEQEGLGRQVALKLIKPEQLRFPGVRERFRREVKTIAKLKHPGIVPIYTVGEDAGIPYFVMEHVRGATLDEVLAALRGRKPETLSGADMAAAVAERAGGAEGTGPELAVAYLFSGSWEQCCLRAVQQVAEALEHAHRRGILHRDIKPSNVMITPAGRALLFDFGLATGEDVTRLTRTGVRLGSLYYMSPEQARGEFDRLDVRTDVYSLGVTLYELLALRPAFAGDSAHEVFQAIQEGKPQPLRRRNPAVSWEAEAVCAKAIDAAAARRYGRAADLARDLGNALDHRPLEARRGGALSRARRLALRGPARWVLSLLFLLLAAGGSIGFGLMERAARLRAEAQSERALESLEWAAGVLLDLGRHEEAARAAEGLLAASPESFEEHVNAARLLLRCADEAERQATAAPGALAEQHAQRALELLGRAAELGFADAAVLRADPSFERLRELPDFQELIERIEKRGRG
ncbi:MAG: protein kinase [Planctomycetes bacterium]|nr:protein kinase [Planctomycetota bacterium]